MNKVQQLINDVGIARKNFIDLIEDVDQIKAVFKPSEDIWNLIDNTEHLFWAEQGGIYGMWKTLYAIRDGKATRTYESEHKDWSIEKLIEQTWKEKEQVPAVAAPRLGGTLIFWRYSFAGLQPLLKAFGQDLKDNELRLQAHPHPISGAMDFQQRLEFLAFHIRRHHLQVENLLQIFRSHL